MYLRYVPNKLLIAHKSRLLFTYNVNSIRDLTSLGVCRFPKKWPRGFDWSRLNCYTQQANCKSGLPAPYYY